VNKTYKRKARVYEEKEEKLVIVPKVVFFNIASHPTI